MLKKNIKYSDFNGNEREDIFMFHLSETEITELDFDHKGSLIAVFTHYVDTKDAIGVARFVKELIIKSYGEKSDDGIYFDKGDNFSLGKRFTRSNAFDVLYRELLTDETGDKLTAFLKGIVPEDVVRKIEEKQKEKSLNTQPRIESFE